MPEKRHRGLRKFNRTFFNPVIKLFAGRFFYSLVYHMGRRSGKEYTTPVVAVWRGRITGGDAAAHHGAERMSRAILTQGLGEVASAYVGATATFAGDIQGVSPHVGLRLFPSGLGDHFSVAVEMGGSSWSQASLPGFYAGIGFDRVHA